MKTILALISLTLAAPLIAAEAPKAGAPKPAVKPAVKPAEQAVKTGEAYKNDDERTIYTIGYLMGRNIASFNLSATEVKIIQAGLADSVKKNPPSVDVQTHQAHINDLLTKRTEAGAAGEKAKGKAYAEQFVKENHPAEIPGGGWYLELQAGTGPMPGPTDTIKAHYRGTTTEGVEFDSSYSRNAPTEFALDRVISCWTHGIAMMKVGGKAKLVCPSDAAYGNAGRPGIKGGATLVFEVELVEIVKQAPAAAAAPADAKNSKKK